MEKKASFVGRLLSENQMSEAFINSMFLALSGGFQDAYTYNCRDEVFSNAQTGNVVLMSQNFLEGNFTAGLRYLFPILFFAMCIGNLRSGTAALSMYLRDKKKEQLRQAGYYFGVILAFAIGAGIGGVFSMLYGIHVIWISCGLLLVSFLLMSLEKYR